MQTAPTSLKISYKPGSIESDFFVTLSIVCMQMVDIRRMLRLDIPELDATYPLLVNYCCALWQHCQQNCEELVCPVLYCGQVNTWCVLFVLFISYKFVKGF